MIPESWFRAKIGGRRIAGGLEDEPARDLRDGERRLAGFILPPFQRPHVWAESQSIRLIESLWEGFPISAYCINRPDDYQNECGDWLLDGQQRWTAIVQYVNGEFPVYGEFFPEVDIIKRRRFRDIPLAECETKLTDPAQCQKIYDRLCYGGTPHEPMLVLDGPPPPMPGMR